MKLSYLFKRYFQNTTLNNHTSVLIDLEIQRQSEYIVENYLEITGNSTDKIAMPLLDTVIHLTSNPGYSKNSSRFYNKVKKRVKLLLLSKGVKETKIYLVDFSEKRKRSFHNFNAFVDHPLFMHFKHMYFLSTDEDTNSVNRISAFSKARLKWPYHDSAFDDIYTKSF